MTLEGWPDLCRMIMKAFSRKDYVLVMDFHFVFKFASLGLLSDNGGTDSEGNSRCCSLYFPEGTMYIVCVAA